MAWVEQYIGHQIINWVCRFIFALKSCTWFFDKTWNLLSQGLYVWTCAVAPFTHMSTHVSLHFKSLMGVRKWWNAKVFQRIKISSSIHETFPPQKFTVKEKLTAYPHPSVIYASCVCNLLYVSYIRNYTICTHM